ncbi:hypothetical protein [Ralstonia phage RSP15]|uniref:hypothetical protein n=1 Tax=Ralstonia phage RSP15 TaxID=1785960 RepID=UPI00074D3DF9|nr:hypothetical protein BH754_gp180 [Ralstonia phage RSP15]BAU40126.1 hypothetical protein [Ralstonia phage RSP15]
MSEVIAFMGNKGVGKDYCADILVKHEGFRNIAFADPLKTYFDLIFDWCDSSLATPENKEKPIDHPLNHTGMSYRELWVEFGALCNHIEPGVFVRHAFRWIDMMKEDGDDKIVITDLRTEKEFIACRENGIKIIKIIPDASIQLPYQSNQGAAFEEFVRTAKGDYEFVNDYSGSQKFLNFYRSIKNG